MNSGYTKALPVVFSCLHTDQPPFFPEEFFMWFPHQIYPDTMNMRIVTKAAILSLVLLSFYCIPVSAYSSDATGWYEQGNAFIKNKSYIDAITAYDHAIVLEPSYAEAWDGKADALNRAEQFTEALTASDRVIALKPDYVPGWINRGYIFYNLGRYDEELGAYETAIGLDPTNPGAWFNKGYSLAGMKRYDEAITAFDKVQALDPTYPNLEANRRIAEQIRDAATPFYIKYAIPLGAAALVVIGAIVWYVAVRKKY
jgi:tetratricopeptide (TPR) repeat protein